MNVSWLHVSDFHIQSGDSYGRDVVLRSLIKSVKAFRLQKHQPDLIFATGDIAFSGKANEYEIASGFFDALIEAAGLNKRCLFVVPGNHDVDRDLSIGLARTLASQEESDKYFQPSTPKPHLIQKQGAFLKWYNQYFEGIRIFQEDSTCGTAEVVDVRGLQIGILGLNSALFSQGDDDHEKLWIGRRCLDKASEQLDAKEARIKVALIHHPLEWLAAIERSNIKSKLFGSVHIILRGHLHETTVDSVVSSVGDVLHLAAGAAYQTRKWPNRAMYATVEGDSLTVFPLRYEDQPHEVWTVDPSLFPTEPNYKKAFRIPGLDVGKSSTPSNQYAHYASSSPFRRERSSRSTQKQRPRGVLAGISLGDPTAEADTEFLFNRRCFVETDLYDSCAALAAPLFIVGRRGTGKTALSMALQRTFQRDSTILSTVIIPEAHYFAHAKSLARSLAEKTNVNWEFLFTSLWATVLRSEWARLLIEYYKVRDSSEDDLPVLIDFVKAAAPDPHESASARLSRYISEILGVLAKKGGDLIGLVTDTLVSYRSERVQGSLARIAAASGVRLVTIVDGLDENWDGSNTSAELVSGLLIRAAAEYPAVGAITFAFLRENMYRRVSNICPRWDRIEGYFYQVAWTEEQIENLILRRIAAQTDLPSLSWDNIFDSEVRGVSSLHYLVRRTQFKPREIILFCRYSVDAANRHHAQKVRASDILEAERRYSENRLKDLLNEYQDSLPELRSIIDLFVGKKQVESIEEFLRLLEEFVSSGRYLQLAPRLSLIYPTREGIFEVLLGVGFVGVRLHNSDSFLFKYYGEQGNVFKEILEILDVSIHPAFEQALGLIQGHAPISTKEANEAEIVAASVSIATRMSSAYERAAEIIGELRDIPPGVGGFKRYEDLMQSAMAFAFQGYLDNPRLQLREWGGGEIRNIIFDNTGETEFFTTIRNSHNALTVPFECKNRTTLEPSDFHQIETFLANTTGDIGFICYRSARREPIRPELSFLRAINSREAAHRRVIMLLSDASVIQLLEQRMKGKLDRFMHKMYTRYMQMYFA
jgi:predicted phosphodiesterase